jgi:hypothetical protein
MYSSISANSEADSLVSFCVQNNCQNCAQVPARFSVFLIKEQFATRNAHIFLFNTASFAAAGSFLCL